MANAALYICTADLAKLQSLVDGQLAGVDRETIDRPDAYATSDGAAPAAAS